MRADASGELLLEEDAEDLYENAPCGYFSTLEDGTIVRVNGTFLAWTGYRREDVLKRKRIHDLLAPGDRIYYETHCAPLLRMQGAVREIALDVVRVDGGRLPVIVNSVVTDGSDGQRALVRTTVFEATDRRRYERELLDARRQAEERARAALAVAHVNEGVLLVDADGRVQLVNRAAEEILGASSDQLVGRPIAKTLPAWDSIAELIPIGAADAWPRPATLPLVRGGEEAWLTVAGVDSGDGIVYTIRDVSSERRLEELRNDLVAVVSHELRTPLAGMYGAAQTLLRHESLDGSIRQQLLEVIVDQGEAQRRVLDDILFTSRLDSGGVQLEEEGFDANELVAKVVCALEPSSASAGRITLELGDPVHVRGDRSSTEQVLTHLVENALKYSPPDVPVQLAVRAGDRWARFTVADEGPGIPAAEQELVFEKFYRLDPEQRKGVSGIGLGLYIAKELVARMHGRIGLLPTQRGATFFVDLPLAS